ncbi:MAG TPA: CehA/McbA family metallohydrolase [Myxococcota bacterium]|nr:CehA/McbA family metallohydrolase [Myxococcota bacterium]
MILIAAAVVCLAANALAADNGGPGLKLAPNAVLRGVTRHEVTTLVAGRVTASPAVTVTPGGEVLTAAVVVGGGRERIFIQSAGAPGKTLGKPVPMTRGFRAWHPRLAAGPDGAVWLTWCGLDTRPEAGSHARRIFLRRLRPGEPGARITVSQTDGRAGNPELAVGPDGAPHVAWEESPAGKPALERIAYRALDRDGQPLADAITISEGPFDRRPAVAVDGGSIFISWDSLVDVQRTGAVDPDYDVFVREIRRGLLLETVPVDERDGIQAAPCLAAAQGGGVLVAYHASQPWGLAKWWSLRRVRSGKVERLAAVDAASLREPSSVMQGAEFPSLGLLADGRAVVASRPSQGAYLEVVTGGKISPVLDLTRHGWGARGMRAVLAVAPDGSLLLARRARRSAVLERFTIEQAESTSLEFEPLDDPPKTTRAAVAVLRCDASGLPGGFPAGGGIFFGDLHMHSAASDGAACQDEVLARAWLRGYTFAALSDHDYIVGSPMFPSKFDEMAWVTDAFNARHNFSTLHAFEWTTPPPPRGSGHRNVYFRGSAPVVLPGYKNGCPDTKTLFAALRGKQAIAIPHHTSWTGTDWNNFDSVLQPQFEIVSLHGVSEHPGNLPVPPRPAATGSGTFAIDGLDRGLIFGFVGGTDAHGLIWHHGVARHRDPWTCGLTAVLASKNTRTEIFDSIRARRTFATSGKPLVALMTAGGVAMGQAGRAKAPLDIMFYARGTKKLVSVSIVRDAKVVHRVRPGLKEYRAAWVDRHAAPGRHYYYLRAQQGRGKAGADLAWSSPVFVTIEHGK